jgi:DNA-binding LytR/AlgR family response regulator
VSIKAVIVDDESPICDEIEYLLGKYPEIEISGKFNQAFDAIAYIAEYRPRLVFLDIHMPGISGLEMARKLKGVLHPPLIVIITAHPEYALEAFDTPTVGYVTKPVTAEKIAGVMDKVLGLIQKSAPLARGDVNKICVLSEGKIIPIAPEDIAMVGVKDKEVYVRTRTAEYATSFNFQDITNILVERSPEKAKFIQVHRQFLVNLDKILEIIPWFHGAYYLKMDDCKSQQVPVSRNKVKMIKEIMGFK